MTLHTKLSYVKSGVRIVGYLCLIRAAYFNLFNPYDAEKHLMWIGLCGALLVVSELIGIAEEAWPGAYKGTETSAPVETAATVNEKLKNVTF